MSYAVTLYGGTGFDANNIPYNESVIESASSEIQTAEALNVNMDRFLTGVDIADNSKLNASRASSFDYCKIGKFYYFITGVTNNNGSFHLSLAPDYWTSLISIATVSGLDGIATRWRVPEANDVWGAYTIDDPLTVPMFPLKLVTHNHFEIPDHTYTVAETPIDLDKLINTHVAITYTDINDKEATVTIPYCQGVDSNTLYHLTLGDGSPQVYSPGTKCYLAITDTTTNKKVQDGLAQLRSIGAESGIISEVRYPSSYIAITANANGEISDISGKNITTVSEIDVNYANVRNKRVLYGEYRKVGIISVAGNKSEFRLENVSPDGQSPVVRIMSDPRPTGAPYFRFVYYMGDNSIEFFFANAVKGMTWQNVPLVWTAPSGSDRIWNAWDDTQYQHTIQRTQAFKNGIGANLNALGNAGLSYLSMSNGLDINQGNVGNYVNNPNYTQAQKDAFIQQTAMQNNQMMAQSASGLIGSVGSALQGSFDLAHNTNWYSQMQQNRELGYAMYAQAPTVQFPIDATTMRDFFGNGFIVYEYQYSDADVKRIDRLLTMYGYAVNQPLTMDMIHAHTDFDYIQATGVSITATPRKIKGDPIPMWLRQGACRQIENGVRFWHVKPDNKYYLGEA